MSAAKKNRSKGREASSSLPFAVDRLFDPPGRTRRMRLPSDISVRWMTPDPARVEALEALLPEEERRQAAAYTFARRRREFILGRTAVRTLLAERLGLEPSQVPLEVAEDGAVEVTGTGLTVSIAHSKEYAVAAVAARTMGIDLERIAPRHFDLPRYMLHPDEFEAFGTLPLDRTHAEILYWALKEATLKALRTGLRLSPRKLRLEVDLAAQSALVYVEDGRRLQLRFEERHDFYCAVAFEGS